MTLTKAARKIRAKRAARPIYVTCMRLMDPVTGVLYGCFVPSHAIDQRLAKERGYKVGHEYRAELKQSRNRAFHRLAHALGHLLVDNVEGFESLSAHDALKRVQAEAGVCCDPLEIDLGPLGKVSVSQPRSISFDEMDGGEFEEFFRGICDHIDRRYLPGLADDVRAEYLLMAGEQRREAA